MFGLKFCLLLLAQMRIITHRSFLSVQYHSIDFLLRMGLYMDQWLNACVAIERPYTIIKGVHFLSSHLYQNVWNQVMKLGCFLLDISFNLFQQYLLLLYLFHHRNSIILKFERVSNDVYIWYHKYRVCYFIDVNVIWKEKKKVNVFISFV